MKKDRKDFVKDKQEQDAPRYYSGIRTPADLRRSYASQRNAADNSRGVARSRPEQDDALSSRG